MNTLLIEKQTGGYFKFTLNEDTANAITSIQNDLLAVGNQLHFKTGNGANIIKEQFIYPADVTIVAGGTFTFTTVAQVWNKLIDIDYFAWLGGGGGGVDRFDELLDTFQYTGNAGKAVIVDNSELKLVPITLYNKRLFTELEDTPSSLVPDKMVVVNPAGTALILKDQPEPPEEYLNSVGYFDYNDLATQTTPLNATANVALKLTNDTEGANTSTDQNPYGVSYVWDYTTNQFNFNELEVGDTIDVRVHVKITTTSANQKVLLSAKFGIGSVAEFTNIIYENQFKSAGLHEINFVAPFYMGSTYITDNPAELYLTTDSSATVKVDGWYVRILRKNINIITVDYQVEDATTTTKGIVRLAGDLGGTANNPTVPELANKVPNTRTVSTTSPLLGGGALSSNLTLSIQQANSVASGFITYADWTRFDEAHNDRIVSAAVTGTTTKTLTLTQHDAGTITTSWTDDNTDTVSSVFGRTGAVVAVSGDYTTSLVTESTNKNYQTDNQKLYNDATSSIQTQLNSKQPNLSGSGIVKSTAGVITYLTDNTSNWDDAYNNKITTAAVTGTTTKTLTLNQQDGGTVTASWIDDNTGNVTSVFGRSGAVVAASGDYTTTQVTEGTNLYYTNTRVSANTDVAANTAARHSAVTLGVNQNGLGLSGQVLSLGLASTSATGALSSTDWNTFNSKQGALNGTGFVKVSGTTVSYDNSTYALDSAVVKLTGDQSIAGVKTFSTQIKSNILFINESGGFGSITGYTQLGGTADYFQVINGTNTKSTKFIHNGIRNLTMPAADGTLALTSDIPTVSGTTNYIPKFTGSTTLGKSLIYDNETNVGIGQSSPFNKLTIEYPSAVVGNSSADGVAFQTSNTGDYIQFLTNLGNYSSIQAGIRGSITGRNLLLNPSGGNVGIGTDAPTEKLTISNGKLALTTEDVTIGGKIYGYNDTSINLYSGGLKFQTRHYDGSNYVYTDKLTITSSGNVGIGTMSPLSKLHVSFTSDSDGLRIQNSNRGNSYLLNTAGGSAEFFSLYDLGSSQYLSFSGNTGHSWWTQGSEKMRITSSGNVGIGATTPSAGLQIDRSSWSFSGSTVSRMLQKSVGYAGDYEQHVILLHPIYNGTLINYNKSSGTIYATRGATSMGLINDTYNFDTASAYNSILGTINSQSGYGRLYTCLYNGVKYIALLPDYRTSAVEYDFDGYIKSTGEQLKVVVYRNSSNGTIVNSEVYNSLTLFTPTTSYVQGGFYVTSDITASGSITATGFFNSSDVRLKELVDYEYSVADIKPIAYLWKDGRDSQKHVGYSAQEVQKVMPDAVNEGSDGMLSVNYVEVLVAKIAQMEKEIELLKSK